MVVSSCKFLSNLFFKSHPIVIRMDDITFLATWDDNTSNVGIANLTKAELKELTTSAGSDKGEHITLMLINTILIGIVYLSDCQKSDKKY